MEPEVIVLLGTLPALLIAWMAMRYWVRRRQLREIRRFQESPRTPNEEFLTELNLNGDPAESDVALRLRDGLAMLGAIPGDSLRASHRFYPDLQLLPYYDSPDFVELILLLEEWLDLPVPDGDHQELWQAVQQGTVGDFIHVALEWRRRKRAPESRSAQVS